MDALKTYDAHDNVTGTFSRRPSAAKRRNEFHHFIGKARVWARCANSNRYAPEMRDGFLAKARADRATAFAWLGA